MSTTTHTIYTDLTPADHAAMRELAGLLQQQLDIQERTQTAIRGVRAEILGIRDDLRAEVTP